LGRLATGIFVLILITGCQAFAPVTKTNAIPEDEGEVYLYSLPFPQEASRLNFTLADVSAVSADDKRVPLSLRTVEIGSDNMQRQLLVASGWLEPGQYTGFSVKASKASMKNDEGVYDLLVSKDAYVIPAPFTVERGKAAVFNLGFEYASAVEKGYGFTPAFSATRPGMPVNKLVGYVSNRGSDDLTVFDKFARQVVGVIPSGSSPGGIVTDQLTGRSYVALPDDDEVDVVDVSSGDIINRIKLTAGDRPLELALTPDGKLLLSVNTGSNTVSFIDPVALVEVGRAATGYEPVSIVMDRKGGRAYTFNSRSNDITIIDIPNRAVAGTVQTEADPLRGQINKSGDRLYVIFSGSAYMSVYALPALSVLDRVYVGMGASAIKVDTVTGLIYIGKKDEDRVSVFDPFSFIPVDYIDIGGPVSYITIDDENNNLLLLMADDRKVAVVNLNNRKDLAFFDVGDDPYYISLMGERN
jgi:YVTN family beta-propeller protein